MTIALIVFLFVAVTSALASPSGAGGQCLFLSRLLCWPSRPASAERRTRALRYLARASMDSGPRGRGDDPGDPGAQAPRPSSSRRRALPRWTFAGIEARWFSGRSPFWLRAAARDPSLLKDQGIVFSSDRDGDFEIYVMDGEGQNVRRLTQNAGTGANEADDHSPSWAPDERALRIHEHAGS